MDDVKEDSRMVFYAFWKYNGYPYCLGGEITRICNQGDLKGCVCIKEFGKNNWFKPCAILPGQQGRDVLSKIEELREEKRQKRDELNAEMDAKARKAFPFFDQLR